MRDFGFTPHQLDQKGYFGFTPFRSVMTNAVTLLRRFRNDNDFFTEIP